MTEASEEFLEKALSAAFALADGETPQPSGAGPARSAQPAPASRAHRPVPGRGAGRPRRRRPRAAGPGRASSTARSRSRSCTSTSPVDARWCSRFVDEAKVGGALEHPGVVPVHELGRTEDGRPYFTMKLVEGRPSPRACGPARRSERTASGSSRSSRRSARSSGYAHSRGVVHLDIKPSNILVGGFGEILVTDWGFAAKLASPDAAPASREALRRGRARIVGHAGVHVSRAGSRRPRADRMPFRRLRAGRHALRDPDRGSPRTRATARPRSCSRRRGRGWMTPGSASTDLPADAALVALARRCLSPDPESRPADAGKIAAEIGRYLRSLDERAQALAIEAAEARTRAEAERRQRKLLVALMTLGVVGRRARVRGVALDRARTRRAPARRRPAHVSVRGALQDADRAGARVGRTRTGPLGDARVGTHARPSMKSRAAAFPRKLRPRSRPCWPRPKRVSRTRPGTIARSRISRPFTSGSATTASTRARTRTTGRCSPRSASTWTRSAPRPRPRESPRARSGLTSSSALDEWAHSRRSRERPTARRCSWTRPTARTRIRGACGCGRPSRRGDVAALEALAASAGPPPRIGGEPDPSRNQPQARWRRSDARDPRARRSRDEHAGDYDVHHELGMIRQGLPTGDLGESISHFSMALALRPRSPHAIVDLGQVLLQAGRLPAGERVLEEARTVDPSYAPAWHYLGAMRLQKREYAAAEPLFRKAAELDPGFGLSRVASRRRVGQARTPRGRGQRVPGRPRARSFERRDVVRARATPHRAGPLRRGTTEPPEGPRSRQRAGSFVDRAVASWLERADELIAGEKDLAEIGSDLPEQPMSTSTDW